MNDIISSAGTTSLLYQQNIDILLTKTGAKSQIFFKTLHAPPPEFARPSPRVCLVLQKFFNTNKHGFMLSFAGLPLRMNRSGGRKLSTYQSQHFALN